MAISFGANGVPDYITSYNKPSAAPVSNKGELNRYANLAPKPVAPKVAPKATPVNKYYGTPSKTTSTVSIQNSEPAPTESKTTTTTGGGSTTTSSSSGSGSSTGSIEKGLLSQQLGVQEELANAQSQSLYDAAVAMRQFQRDQASRQLKDALGSIDRAAIENYKGIGNDYAARGLSRSGGYMNQEAMAMADKVRADEQANQTVEDFVAQLDLQGTADLDQLNLTKQGILADFLARRYANPGVTQSTKIS